VPKPPLATMSHGEKRQLELAVAVAMQPTLLLLDEPLAGAGLEDTDRLIGLLRSLRSQYGILLVEHDMQAVFRPGRPDFSAGLWPHRRHRRTPPASAITPKSARRILARTRCAESRKTSPPATGKARCCSAVSFSIGRGEVLALLGPQTAMGKTTTVSTILGLLPAWSGALVFEGSSIVGLAPFQVARRGLGLVPEGRLIFPTLTVEEKPDRHSHAPRFRLAALDARSDMGLVPRAARTPPRYWQPGCRAASSRCWRSAGR